MATLSVRERVAALSAPKSVDASLEHPTFAKPRKTNSFLRAPEKARPAPTEESAPLPEVAEEAPAGGGAVSQAAEFASHALGALLSLLNSRADPAPVGTYEYPIGTPGIPWGRPERAAWVRRATAAPPARSYAREVLDALAPLKREFEVLQYGALPHDPARYPLFCVRSYQWDARKPCVLVTGGVHGYEKSGVQGALRFLASGAAREYALAFNLLVLPCVSPWGYEHVQRWNRDTVDPNRAFGPSASEGPAEEARAVMRLLDTLAGARWAAHVDLHETTDSDEGEFRPAKAARNGDAYFVDAIPDGFYLVGDSADPQPAFHKAVIEGVRAVTHVAPDERGCLIGEPITQEGVIAVPAAELGLCMGVTNATFRTTTEVYPDSPHVTEDECNRAQVAAVRATLDFILASGEMAV